MFARKVLSVLTSQIAFYILAVSSGIILARSLGRDIKGQYDLIFALNQFIALLCNLGLGAATIYLLNRNPEKKSEIAATGFWMQIVITLVMVIFFILFNQAVSRFILDDKVPTNVLLLGLCLVPISSLLNIQSLIFLGIGQVGKYNFIRVLPPFFIITFVLIFVVWLQMGVTGALISFGLSSLVVASLGMFWVRQNGIKLRALNLSAWKKPMFSYGLKSWLGNLLQFFNYRLDVFIINFFFNPGQVALYHLGVALSEIIWHIPNAVAAINFPKTAANWDEAKSFTPFLARTTGYISLFLSSGLILLGFPFIYLAYGTDFIGAYPALLSLLPGTIFMAVGKVVASDLAGRGKPHYGTLSAFISLILTILLDLLLIPRIGVVGAGIASSASYIMSALVLILLYVRLTSTPIHLLLFDKSDLPIYLQKFQAMLKAAQPLLVKFHLGKTT